MPPGFGLRVCRAGVGAGVAAGVGSVGAWGGAFRARIVVETEGAITYLAKSYTDDNLRGHETASFNGTS
jgi:hypothetical protein